VLADRNQDPLTIRRPTLGARHHAPPRRRPRTLNAQTANSAVLVFLANGEVQTLGCNEVPKANGGTYWSSDADDARDYTLEGDENERIKRAILADTVRRLALSGFISDQSQVDELVSKVIAESSKKDSPLKGSQLMDLLEFGRIIHAEMSAISDAARLGIPIKGSILYCTTFPCHMCSKHIVAAGIGRVLYIEPYPKSYAEQLQQDSLYVGTGANKTQKVQFSPFIGISPLRFRDLFERGKRKDDKGFFSDWMEGKPKPLVDYTIAIYLNSEEEKRKLIKEILAELLRKGEILEFSDHDVSQQVEAAQQLTVASSPSTDATPDA
ncbi:deaminase, partial [Methylobacterium sp. WL8]|uniref:deaminase n=1 Tax=Methylobacterium sp. WL8 TaxID=2603899 RepID=UPI001FEFA014